VKWEKAPEELVKTLESAMAGIDSEKRLMFGYPAYFINKNMFSGLFQDQLFARLSAIQLSSMKKKYPAIKNLEPMVGRPMKDYFVLPKELCADSRKVRDVLQEAAGHARTLPPKAKKAPKKTKKE
jgi:hypothetical protein